METPLDMLNSVVVSTIDMSRVITNIFDTIHDATLVILSTEIVHQIATSQQPDITQLTSFKAFSFLVSQLCQLSLLQLNSIEITEDNPQYRYITNLKTQLGEIIQKKENIILH